MSHDPGYGDTLREIADDFREWEDSPPHVRERCLHAEAQVRELTAAVDGLVALVSAAMNEHLQGGGS